MKVIKKDKLSYIALAFLAVSAIIVLSWFAPLQRTGGVHIVSDIGISQGAAENNSELESIQVHGTVWNEGDITANNFSGIIIFADAAHNKVVKKDIPVNGDLLPNKGLFMAFDSEYTRKKTIPKTYVNVTIQFDWIENGQSKNNSICFRASNPGDANYRSNQSNDDAVQLN